jgi:hypothetical protein
MSLVEQEMNGPNFAKIPTWEFPARKSLGDDMKDLRDGTAQDDRLLSEKVVHPIKPSQYL